MIENLTLQPNFWPMLALDHGLTGHRDAVPVPAIPSLLKGCREHIGSVVMTYGLARRFTDELSDTPLVIQCFCSPFDHPKVQVCGIDQAISLGAVGIAVQIDFSLPKAELNSQIVSISKLVYQAHQSDISVLFMIAYREIKSFVDLAEPIRFCQELGADLVKIRFDDTSLEEEINVKVCRSFLNHAPPVLLAGGAAHSEIVSEIRSAKKLGFSGYCIGRNIYQSDSPPDMAGMLRRAWYDEV